MSSVNPTPYVSRHKTTSAIRFHSTENPKPLIHFELTSLPTLVNFL